METEIALIAVVGIVTIVAVAAFSKPLGVAAPLVLVVVGVGASFIPGLTTPIVIPSWVILTVVLPPLLYANAVQVPILDFRRNLGSITTLSVWLVIGTSVAVGFMLNALLPGLGLAAGIALGAVVSPTDAVAATTIAKRLGLPARLIAVLEGESLVNDASALVLLKTAIAATGAGISLWAVAGDFIFSVIVALVIGLIVGMVTVYARSRLNDSVLETSSSFAVPFIAYLPTDALGASGVLAVVVAGLYTGYTGARRFSAQARISERLNWRTVQFILENGVFLLMGLQLNTIIRDVPSGELGFAAAVLIGILVCLALFVIRVAFVVPLLVGVRAQQRRAAAVAPRISSGLRRLRGREAPEGEKAGRRLDRATRYLERREADNNELQESRIGWRSGLVISWAGMRGVVTLAAAQSLPNGTPYRSQLILIAFTVAILTLLVQGGTLPWIIRLTGIRGSDAAADHRELTELLDEVAAVALEALDRPELEISDGEPYDEEVVEQVRRETRNVVEAAREGVGTPHDSDSKPGPHRQYLELRTQVLEAERAALLEARSKGTYSSRVLSRANALLDLEETRLAQMSDE